VHAIDALTGSQLWQSQVDPHPAARVTGAPVLYRGRLYVALASREEGAPLSATYECCSFRGSLSALDPATGKLIWRSFAIAEPPKPVGRSAVGVQLFGPAGAAIWSAPTIDPKRGLIYVGTGNSYTTVPTDRSDAIVAFDLDSGAVRWSMQATPRDNFLVNCFPGQLPAGIASCPKPLGPDFDFGSSPILRTLPDGRSVLLAGQKSGVIFALDPDNGGRILWQVKLGQGSPLGGIEWGPAADAENVYVAISDVIPFPEKRLGSLTALRIATGERLWQKVASDSPTCWGGTGCSGAQSAAVSVIPGVVFSGAQDGHLRAYATNDGTVVWDVDTAKQFATVNGVPANGGSLDVGGPVIANGMLFTNSGYGRFRGQPGNALLAFSVDGR
jgi:polyvinyl alcohol dehydrogenase (cytochrome)